MRGLIVLLIVLLGLVVAGCATLTTEAPAPPAVCAPKCNCHVEVRNDDYLNVGITLGHKWHRK